jgi:hypothetical protein
VGISLCPAGIFSVLLKVLLSATLAWTNSSCDYLSPEYEKKAEIVVKKLVMIEQK